MPRLALVLAALVAVVASPAVAAADPGDVDLGFRHGGVLLFKRSQRVVRAWPVDDGLRWLLDVGPAWRFGAATADGRGRPLAQDSSDIDPTVVLPDGSVVSARYRGSGPQAGWDILRYTPRGTRDRSFGGPLTIFRPGPAPYPDAWGVRPSIAAAVDGRVAVLDHRDGVLRMLRRDGSLDPTFAPRTFPGEELTGFAFDDQGRLLVATQSPAHPGQLRRLGTDGAEDPVVGHLQVGFRPDELIIAPGGHVAVVDGRPWNMFHRVVVDLDAARVMSLPQQASTRLRESGLLVFDAAGRPVMVHRDAILRGTPDFSSIAVLRPRLPGGRFGMSTESLGVDRQGRILVAGYRYDNVGDDPFYCDYCRDDTAETTGELVALEGGVRRVAILTRRLGPTVTVECLQAAEARCAGTVTAQRGGRAVLRVRIRITAGHRARLRLPVTARRGASSLRVTARVHDGTGEVASATRVLRRA